MKLDYFVLATITNDSIKSRTVECIERARWTLSHNKNIGFYHFITYGDGKARSRSIAATKFLEDFTGSNPDIVPDYLVFLDSDIIFTPDDLGRLYSDLKSGYDLIGGLFAVRGGTQPSSFCKDNKLMLDGKIYEFEYIATGFMGISRRLLTKIRDELKLPLLHPYDLKFYSFFEEKSYPDRPNEAIFLSEDYDFCDKAKQVGIKPYIDTHIQLGHIGEYTYCIKDVVDYQVSKGAHAEQSEGAKARMAFQEAARVKLDEPVLIASPDTGAPIGDK